MPKEAKIDKGRTAALTVTKRMVFDASGHVILTGETVPWWASAWSVCDADARGLRAGCRGARLDREPDAGHCEVLEKGGRVRLF